MPIPYKPLTRNGQNVAVDNELNVLKSVRSFGHLRRQEIAMACWPNTSFRSSKEMANRTVRRLIQSGALLERPNSLGGKSVILGTRGVSRLMGIDIHAQVGHELAFDGPQFFHRTLGTSYLLEKARLGHRVYGEYAILKAWSPVSRDFLRQRYGKVPDGLIVYSGESLGMNGMHAADWIEVESAFKSYEEVQKALNILTLSPLLTKDESLTLEKLVFVYDSRQKHDTQILRYIQRYLKEHPDIDASMLTQNIVFACCFVDVPFTWHGVQEVTALELLSKGLMAVEAFNEVPHDARGEGDEESAYNEPDNQL